MSNVPKYEEPVLSKLLKLNKRYTKQSSYGKLKK
jgi:hypothetical protein